MNEEPILTSLQRICAQDPLAAVLVAEKLDSHAEGEIWAWPPDGPIMAIVWVGANLIPAIPPSLPDAELSQAIDYFVGKARQWGQRCSAITGTAQPTLQLWGSLRQYWPTPREVRYHQPLYLLDQIADGQITQPKRLPWPVQITSPNQIELLLPAAIAMFTEEIGYSPARFGLNAYRDHVAKLVAGKRSYSMLAGQKVVFKADVGAIANGIALLQGVWVTPELRGQGIAKPALNAVIADIQQRLAPQICLYVNQSNARAIHLYESLGFRQIGEAATILF